jgi:hypothetical protein
MILYTTGYTRKAIVHNGVLNSDIDLLMKPFTSVEPKGSDYPR